MTIAAVLWLVQAAVFLPLVEGAVKKTTVKKAPARKAATPVKSANAKKAVPKGAVAASAKAGVAKKGPAKAAPAKTAAHSSQRMPSQDRYQEIQQALSEKGYYQGTVNGNWGPESTAALKKFQRDQKLTEDGKLSSKSIIALGLGPQRSAAATGKEQ